MEYKSIKISPRDNVAVVVQQTPKGKTVTIPGSMELVTVNHDIPFGHKIAIVQIAKGADIIRYGETICTAAEDINPGDWVHVHNTISEEGS